MAQQGRPTAGDMTGRLKERAGKEARLDDTERSAAAAVENDVVSEAERNGVHDPKSGERIDAPAASHVAVEAKPAAAFGKRAAVAEDVLSGKEAPEVVDAVVAKRSTFTPPPENVVRNAFVTVRVSEDVEDMTYGMINGEPNNYTFREGLKYQVPIAVADHLNERGLVSQWFN